MNSMMIRNYKQLFSQFVLLCFLSLGCFSFTQAETPSNRFSELLSHAQQNGTVRVMVKLDINDATELLKMPSASIKRKEKYRKIANRQSDILDKLQRFRLKQSRRLKALPYMVLEIDAAGLNALNTMPEIIAITEDKILGPSLSQSVPLVGADVLATYNIDGHGQAIAILDTGVDTAHSFLQDNIIAEACFSTTSSSNNSTTLCPNGLTAQFGPGAGIYCNNIIESCGHGTHVAGIAAGNGALSSGVAKRAGIISIQVYSRFDNSSLCNSFNSVSPCALSYASDQVSALDYVISLNEHHAIAAVNLSLGAGRFTSTAACDTDVDNQAYKEAVDALRLAGTATIVASGNNGYSNASNFPACLSDVIAVGATTKSDIISSFSNNAPWVKLLAPGSSITSAKSGGGFEIQSGTSMATPHVAGAWAMLKSKWPQASVDEILTALSEHGQWVLDTRNGQEKPRIQLDESSYAYYTLHSGINFVGINPDRLPVNDTFSLLEFLGSPDIVSGLQSLDADNQLFEATVYDGVGMPSGTNASIQPGDGWLVYSEKNRLVPNGQQTNCGPINLKPGVNMIGFPCARLGKTAYGILEAIALVTSNATIQGFNYKTGRFDTAALSDLVLPIGKDFPIDNATTYLIEVIENTTVLLN